LLARARIQIRLFFGFLIIFLSSCVLFLFTFLWWNFFRGKRLLEKSFNYNQKKAFYITYIVFLILSEAFFFLFLLWAFYDVSSSPTAELGPAWPPKPISYLSLYPSSPRMLSILLARALLKRLYNRFIDGVLPEFLVLLFFVLSFLTLLLPVKLVYSILALAVFYLIMTLAHKQTYLQARRRANRSAELLLKAFRIRVSHRLRMLSYLKVTTTYVELSILFFLIVKTVPPIDILRLKTMTYQRMKRNGPMKW